MKAHFRGGPYDGLTIDFIKEFPYGIIMKDGARYLRDRSREIMPGGSSDEAFYIYDDMLGGS